MQLEILLFLQKISNPFLDKAFIFITNLGSETAYILIMTFIFWCVNKKLGVRLFVITMVSSFTNSILKDIFHIERPIAHEEINSLYTESAPGYSFPSGHTQISTTFWFYLMYKIKDKKLYFLGSIIIILIGLSRLYLRVHWPIDVLGGLAFGIGIALLGYYLIEKVTKIKFNYTAIIILSIIIPSILLIVYPTENNVKLLALVSGALIGYFTEEKLLGFDEKSKTVMQILKYIIGISIFLGLKSVLKLILPEMLIFNYFRYLVLGLWITLIAPWIFIKLGIASTNPRI